MAKKTLRRGFFITFEGPEGCGKSTHARLLCAYMRKRSYPCIYTREPGGTQLGEKVREILLGLKTIRVGDLAEVFLFEACRAQIVEEVIGPALAEKTVVICDRFSDATVCYQGYGGGVDRRLITSLNRIATRGIVPHLTILLDIDTAEGLKRSSRKGVDRMEEKEVAYHRKVRAGYLALAKACPERIKVIKVDGAIDAVQAKIRKEADRVLHKHR